MQAILVEGGFDVRGMKIAHSKGLVALLVLLLVQGITRLNPAEPGLSGIRCSLLEPGRTRLGHYHPLSVQGAFYLNPAEPGMAHGRYHPLGYNQNQRATNPFL